MKTIIKGSLLCLLIIILLVGSVASFVVSQSDFYIDKFNDTTYEIHSLIVKGKSSYLRNKPEIGSGSVVTVALAKKLEITQWENTDREWIKATVDGVEGYLKKTEVKVSRESKITVVDRVLAIFPQYFKNLKLWSQIPKDADTWGNIGAGFVMSVFKFSYWRIIILCFALIFVVDIFFLYSSPHFFGNTFDPLVRKFSYIAAVAMFLFLVVLTIVANIKKVPLSVDDFIKIVFSPIPPVETKLISEWLAWVAGKLVPLAYIIDVIRMFRNNAGKTKEIIIYSAILLLNIALLLGTMFISIPGGFIVLLLLIAYIVLQAVAGPRYVVVY